MRVVTVGEALTPAGVLPQRGVTQPAPSELDYRPGGGRVPAPEKGRFALSCGGSNACRSCYYKYSKDDSMLRHLLEVLKMSRKEVDFRFFMFNDKAHISALSYLSFTFIKQCSGRCI